MVISRVNILDSYNLAGGTNTKGKPDSHKLNVTC